VASPARYSSLSSQFAHPFPQTAAKRSNPAAHATVGIPPVTALSIEFVAKPQEAHRVQVSIPSAIASAMKDVNGFAGCLVMVSDQEARLVTVVTLWAGSDRAQCCQQNIRWVQALLKPYLDRGLRVQRMTAHLPALPLVDFLPAFRTENFSTDSTDIHSLQDTDETVCVA